MGHYAFLNEQNVVVDVITGRNENEVVNGISDWEQYYGNLRNQVCKRTSYNTRGGVNENGTPFRKNYAGIGFTYDPNRDAFIAPQPFPSWTLNEETCLWEPPVPMPQLGSAVKWDEPTLSWIELNE